MTTNQRGCKEVEVDAAKARLAAAKEHAQSASQIFDAVAKTAGFAQLASNQIGAAGTVLIDAASETMELARDHVVRFRREVEEAEKDLRNAEQEWVRSESGNGTQSQGRKETQNHLNGAGTRLPTAQSKKRRPFHGTEEVSNDGSANLKYDGGEQCAALKKSKIHKIIPATKTFGITATATGFSFGAVPATLPAQPFVFGANSANGTAPCSSSTPVPSFRAGDVSPAGKRKTCDGSSTDDIARAPTSVLETRKIIRASKKWRKSSPREAANGVKIASKIFGSVKLTPSTTSETEKEKRSDSSAAVPAPSASAEPVVSFPDFSSTDMPANKGDEGAGNTGDLDKAEEEEINEEETVYEVRARRFKLGKNGWDKCGTGHLRISRHNETFNCHMLMRNATGQVQFNVAISKGMSFDKVVKETDKGKSTYVRFGAVEDASRGVETFMLQIKPEFMDELHEVLQGLAEIK